MYIAVIGCDCVGAVYAVSMAELGYIVVSIDVDPFRIQKLVHGGTSIVKPGCAELIDHNLASGRLASSTDHAAIEYLELYFIGVGTPQRSEGHKADLTSIHAAIDSLLPYLNENNVIAGKFTFPVETAASLEQRVCPTGTTPVWNPEFLRKGFAVRDALGPGRLMCGLPVNPTHAAREEDALNRCYSAILKTGTSWLLIDFETAEPVKDCASSCLTTEISFINAMIQMYEKIGASTVADLSGDTLLAESCEAAVTKSSDVTTNGTNATFLETQLAEFSELYPYVLTPFG